MKTIVQSLSVVTQFSINMLVPIGIMSFVGYVIDQKLGTEWVVVLMFFVGAAAGFQNVYRLAMKISKPSDRRLKKPEELIEKQCDENAYSKNKSNTD